MAKKNDKKKNTKKAPVKYSGPTLDNVYSSKEFGALSPEYQKIAKAIFSSYTPEEARKLDFSKTDIKAFVKEAGKAIIPYYDRIEKELTSDYNQLKQNQINSVKTELARAKEDYQRAIANGDTTLAEASRVQFAGLNEALGTLKKQQETYINNASEILNANIAAAKSQLETSFGRTDEDKVRDLKAAQRQAEKQLDTYRQTAQMNGYAMSGYAKKDQQNAQEEANEIRSTIISNAERQKQDAARAVENMFGTAVADDLDAAASYLEGGIEGSAQMATRQDINRIMQETGTNMQDRLRNFESLFGTEAAIGLARQFGINPIGGVRGAEVMQNQMSDQMLGSTYGRNAQDLITGFNQQYGDEATRRAFGQRPGAITGVFGGSVMPDIKTPTATNQYKRAVRENVYDKNAAVQAAVRQKKQDQINARIL